MPHAGGCRLNGVAVGSLGLAGQIDFVGGACLRILSVLEETAKPASGLSLGKFVVPDFGEAHFAILFDIDMMVGQDGRQRTVDKLAALLSRTGWRRGRLLPLHGSPLNVLKATIA